ncbi:putative type VI secretion system effector [Gilliamella apicola]|uniref:putative type VI secretion system effector n=1 Tax=Gilliamella apicola TaxID=1196095 RepID=UPI002FEE3B5A
MSIKTFYKIQKEVEDRSWRHQPTKPVLPCLGNEFIAIRGKIERIDKEVEEHGFEIESYEHVKKSIQKMREGAKIGAILGTLRGQYGLTGGAYVEPARIKANFVNVQINNEIYRGWVGDCPFEAGDEVEVVVEWQNDHYELYAIAKPDERIISVCPNCFRGRWAYFFYTFPRAIITLLIILLVMTGFYIHYNDLDSVLTLDEEYTEYISVLTFFFGSLTTLALYMAIKDSLTTKVKIAEQIFKALNLDKLTRIDLRKKTNRKVRRLKRQGTYQSNSLKPKIILLTWTNDNYLFYY